MSVDVARIIGYTITLKKNLTHQDFDFFHSLEDKYKEFAYGGEYCQWGGGVKNNKVVLIVDGMSSEYARLVYVENIKEDIYVEEDEYLLLKDNGVSKEIYESLNRAYQMIYNEPLDKNNIEYALWYWWC